MTDLEFDILVYSISILGGLQAFVRHRRKGIRRVTDAFPEVSALDHVGETGKRATIEGRVQREAKTIPAPMTSEPCVVWQLYVRATDVAACLGQHHQAVPFVLETHAGNFLIEFEGPWCFQERNQLPWQSRSPRVRGVPTDFGGRAGGDGNKNSYQWQIAPGDEVTIGGVIEWVPESPMRSASDGIPQLKIIGTTEQPAGVTPGLRAAAIERERRGAVREGAVAGGLWLFFGATWALAALTQ